MEYPLEMHVRIFDDDDDNEATFSFLSFGIRSTFCLFLMQMSNDCFLQTDWCFVISLI